MIGWLVLGLAAMAQEPEVSEEITVEADAVRRARQAVIRELTTLGYDRVKEKDGYLVLKHDDTWKGKILLHDDGFIEHRRQGIRIVEGPAKSLPRGTRWLPCILIPTGCVQSGLGVSERKLDAEKARTLEAVQPELVDLSERLADAALAETLDLLPARLEALWAEGAPLEREEEPLATMAQRREALLAFWGSRTDTRWGQAVREAVEAFARGVVVPSDTPFTEAELEAARARYGRRFPVR